MTPLVILRVLCIVCGVLLVGEVNSAQQQTYEPITILNQSNVYELFYDLTNKIQCDNYTDYWGFPVFQAADDFVLPAWTGLPTVHHVSADCAALNFTFTTVRSYQDQDPASITLQLFYDNQTAPRSDAFFTRTFCAPGTTTTPMANCAWPRKINIPINITLALANGDVADDGVTVFDLNNASLLPVGRRLWVSFYATVPEHKARNLLRSNSLYWMTLNAKNGSSPLVDPFPTNAVPNAHYHYRDTLNMDKINATDWVDATYYQLQKPGLFTTTYNMAFAVSLHCLYIPPVETLPPSTGRPTWSPVPVVVVVVVVVNTTTGTPTSVPTTTTTTTTLAPTSGAPADVTTQPITDGPTPPPTTNTTNTTVLPPWMVGYLAQKQTQLIIYSVIGTLLLIILCCFVLYWLRRRGYCCRRKVIVINDTLNAAEANGDIEMNPLHNGHGEHDFSLSSATSVQRTPTAYDQRKTWMDSNTVYTAVELDDTATTGRADDSEASAREWLHEPIPVATVTTRTNTNTNKKKTQ